MKTEDEGIQAVRDVRRRISAQFENDPQKLVEHYMAEQAKHRDRLLQPDCPLRIANEQTDL